MGSPLEHLPKSFDHSLIINLLEDLKLPPRADVKILGDNSGQFHIIYVLTFNQVELTRYLNTYNIDQTYCHPTDLILRISGDHIPQIKTENEVAILSWLTRSTKIPVPLVVAFASSNNNALGHEFILMTRSKGQAMAEVYSQLTKDQMKSFLDQIIDVQVQLHAQEWSHIGGLYGMNEAIGPGPYVAEDQWFLPEVSKYFPGETFESINAIGPFETYVESIVGDMERYIHIISIHESLTWMKSTIPLLQTFVSVIQASADELNHTRVCLAHKDLHFGNIMIDPATAQITAILDWEFSGPAPYSRWDSHRSFLWNTGKDNKSKSMQNNLRQQYAKRVKEQGHYSLLEDSKYTSRLQEQMQTVRDYCRAIVEVCPRGQRQELVQSWKKSMLRALEEFEIH